MTNAKYLGIWMDNASANLIEYTSSPMESKTIESEFTSEVKQESIGKSENLMHNKEQHQQAAYYKKLGEVILHYNEVVLFGPTHAKMELYNILKADHKFANIKIAIKQTDKMTVNEEHAFVRDYFLKQNLAL